MVKRESVIITVTLIYAISIGLIILHHQLIHDGLPFQIQDFQDSFYYIAIKSHEGIITLLLISGISIVLGMYIEKELR